MRRYFGAEPPNAEYIAREHQAQADVVDHSGAVSEAASKSMQSTPVGSPPTLFDVRCIFDSRPANAYDFNFISTRGSSGTGVVFTFPVPNGYRAVPREWTVAYDLIPVATPNQITGVCQANGADVPNNIAYIGSGTTLPIRSFYVVEENATFGMRIIDPGGLISGNVLLQVYGNLLPVTGVALPFEVTNRKI
jgi:hypothetical protein